HWPPTTPPTSAQAWIDAWAGGGDGNWSTWKNVVVPPGAIAGVGQLTEARGPEFAVMVRPVVEIGASAHPRLVTVTSTTNHRSAQRAAGSHVIAPEASASPTRQSPNSHGARSSDGTYSVRRGCERRLP